MIESGFDTFGRILKSVKDLTALSSCDIWALIAFSALAYIWWQRKEEFKSQEGWRGIREKQIASETAQTEVQRELIEEVASLKMVIVKHLIREGKSV